MPRYFFDLDDGIHVRDEQGQELSDGEAARREAICRASDYAADPNGLGRDGAVVVTVRDETREVVMSVRLVCQIESA